FLAAALPTRAAGYRQQLLDEALAVLDHPDFSALLADGGRSEVAITGRLRLLDGSMARVDGRIDRLCVEPERILIVDYKSGRPPAAAPEELDDAHVGQLASYAELLASVYPGKRVEAALLFTAIPRLVPVPDALLLAARRRLFAAP